MAISITPKTKALTGMALAGALLLGGSGTFAWWSASTEMSAGQLVSGTLSIEESSAGSSWEIFKYENNAVGDSLGTATAEEVKTDFMSKIRPGTQYSYNGTFDVVIDGHKMAGFIKADTKSLEGSLATLMDKGVKVESGAVKYRKSGTSGEFETLAADTPLEQGKYEVKTGVSIIFPETITNADLQNETIDITGFAIKLTQADNNNGIPSSNI